MIIEMNVEAQDLKVADMIVRSLIPGPKSYVHTRVEIVEYDGPNGSEKNGVLVVRAVVQDLTAAIGIAYQAAVLLDQDCVALLDCSPAAFKANGVGMLIGPNADKWGRFDMQFFKRFA